MAGKCYLCNMIIALILILFAVALFLIFHDDHDDSYTRRERNAGRNAAPKSFYDKSETPKPSARKPSYQTPSTPKPVSSQPSPFMDPRTIVPKEKEYRAGKQGKLDGRFKPAEAKPQYASAPNHRQDPHVPGFIYDEDEKVLDFHFLDQLEYDADLPERTMSSFIAGLGAHCTEKDLGGMVGTVKVDPVTEAMEVFAADGRLMGYLPMKDKAAYHTFNPDWVDCPFAAHVALSVTGRYYADIRIVLPSSRDFVEESLTGFLA